MRILDMKKIFAFILLGCFFGAVASPNVAGGYVLNESLSPDYRVAGFCRTVQATKFPSTKKLFGKTGVAMWLGVAGLTVVDYSVRSGLNGTEPLFDNAGKRCISAFTKTLKEPGSAKIVRDVLRSDDELYHKKIGRALSVCGVLVSGYYGVKGYIRMCVSLGEKAAFDLNVTKALADLSLASSESITTYFKADVNANGKVVADMILTLRNDTSTTQRSSFIAMLPTLKASLDLWSKASA
jgi:hypothetical protein